MASSTGRNNIVYNNFRNVNEILTLLACTFVMKRHFLWTAFSILGLAHLLSSPDCSAKNHETSEVHKDFESLLHEDWEEFFYDTGTHSWQKQWFLDGRDAVVANNQDGMRIDATKGFAVLWTKANFKGDLRIEYDFKRVDSSNSGVNIIYIQATGDKQNGHDTDIRKWSHRRTQALMSDYFLNMHTYHISYATRPKDYIRARRYLPLQDTRLEGTKMTGETQDTGMFVQGRWVKVRIIKREKDLFIEVSNPTESALCHFINEDKPGIDLGRIGLRLMPGRISQFKDFRISQLRKPER